jgi:hypothetical protein
LQTLQYSPELLAYVGGVLKAQAHPRTEDNLVARSIILEFRQAMMTYDFVQYQRLGDWILWVDVMTPEYFAENRNMIDNIARLSYSACYNMMHGKWQVYAELADGLPVIAQRVRNVLV